jgi:hypothetical protein
LIYNGKNFYFFPSRRSSIKSTINIKSLITPNMPNIPKSNWSKGGRPRITLSMDVKRVSTIIPC